MEVIKRKNGTRYRAKVRINGRPITKVFERKIDANNWKNQVLAEKRQIEIFGAPELKEITFKEFAELWFTNKPNLAKSSIRNYRSVLDCYLFPKFSKYSLKDIRLNHGQELASQLRKSDLSPSRSKLVIVVLKMLLKDAIKWDYLRHDPLKNLSLIKIPKAPEIYWLQDEANKFLTANKDDENYALYVTALNTGMRLAELLGLRWDKVDFVSKMIEVSSQRNRHGQINRTKNGKIAYVPMNQALERELLKLKSESRSLEYVFVKRNGKIIHPEHFSERTFSKAIERAGVKKISFRYLRTTFATNLCMSGGALQAASKILNHSSLAITAEKYAHLNSEYLKRAVNCVSFEANGTQMAHAHLSLVKSD